MPPDAWRFADPPQGIDVVEAVTDAVLADCTAIAMVAVSDPQLLLTITVYVVLLLGVATGLAAVVLVNPVEGLHK